MQIQKLSASIIVDGKDKQVLENISLEINPGEIHLLMGPNGAGKSTFAKALMGHPEFKISGSLVVNKDELIDKSTDIRSKEGLFISHQNPVEIPGVKLLEFLKTAYNEQHEPKDRVDIWGFLTIFQKAIAEAGLGEDFADREVNTGFSGGEKKKSEIMQLILLHPKYAILDEIDSGLDVDAMKQIYTIINKLSTENNTAFVIITHNPNILDYVNPAAVHILKEGKIIESGGKEVAEKIIKKGFK